MEELETEFCEPPPPPVPMLELISLEPTSLLAGLMDMAEEGVAGATPGELRPVPGELPDSSRQSGEESSPASCGWETSREEEQQLAWSESGSSLSHESNAGYFTLKLSI